MALLTREMILAMGDLPRESVAVMDWDGGEVLVQGLTAAQRDKFEADSMTQQGKDFKLNMRNIRARLVALCVVDENGQRIFSDSDVQALGQKSARALARVFEVAQRLSGLTNEDVEELAKNSDGGQPDDLLSD